jgi:hypothetical protein
MFNSEYIFNSHICYLYVFFGRLERTEHNIGLVEGCACSRKFWFVLAFILLSSSLSLSCDRLASKRQKPGLVVAFPAYSLYHKRKKV